jgi:hypothetical protein
VPRFALVTRDGDDLGFVTLGRPDCRVDHLPGRQAEPAHRPPWRERRAGRPGRAGGRGGRAGLARMSCAAPVPCSGAGPRTGAAAFKEKTSSVWGLPVRHAGKRGARRICGPAGGRRPRCPPAASPPPVALTERRSWRLPGRIRRETPSGCTRPATVKDSMVRQRPGPVVDASGAQQAPTSSRAHAREAGPLVLVQRRWARCAGRLELKRAFRPR